MAKKKAKKKTVRKAKKEPAVKVIKLESGKLSKKATKEIVGLLRSKKGGSMSINDIAKAIGKSPATVYNMSQGKARLSAADYGNLAGKIGSSLWVQVCNITMDDVKNTAEAVKKYAKQEFKKATKDAGKAARDFSKRGGKAFASNVGAFLTVAGDFISGLGGEKKGK